MDIGTGTADIGYFWAALLGLIQGLTEFLPVSSSGHLALIEHLGLGHEAPPAFDAFLHFATLGVVLAYFRRSILWYWHNGREAIWFAVAGTVPAALIGLACKEFFEALRQSPAMICLGLLVTASALATAEMRKNPTLPLRDLGWSGAVVVGLFQALALAPGISRSGLTIAGGMLCGTDRAEAFRFSFMLSIPAVLGAAGLHGLEMLRHGAPADSFAGGTGIGPLLLGMAAAAAAGGFALALLERLVVGGRLVWFAGYCCLAALAGLVYFSLRATTS
ncbi:MAG: undecaprenyl-diphosphate phosphatase [Planctomycetota bacterium]|jgi:undecaprenyl-diphosphatase|nr:undecaprenyl-diphosphate phosphatase [Planctomycetota bacterium]